MDSEFDLTLKTLIYQTPIPTVIYINETIYDCNDAFLNLFEVENKEEIIGKSPYKIFCSGENHLNGTRYLPGIKCTNLKKIELKAKTFKGKIIYVVIHEAHIIYANKNAIISQIFDITKYKETELRLRALINATPDIICFKDGDGRWIEANDADLKLFSLKGVDYKGKKDIELAQYTHSIYKKAFLTCEKTDEEAWLKGSQTRNEEIIPQPDGNIKIYDVIKVPLYNDDGSRKGLVVLGRDITDLKNTQKKLEIQLKFSQALNKIAEKIIAEDDRKKIFEYIVEIVKNTLNIDQCKVFRANLKEKKILPIAAKIEYSAVRVSFYDEIYSLDKFPLSYEYIINKQNFLISHSNNINPLLIQEKSDKLIHDYYQIKSLLWYLISKDSEGFYFIALNNIRTFHKWEDLELNFIASVSKLLEILLMKIKIIEEREHSIETMRNLATIIYQSINSIVLTDLEGNIEYANPAFEILTGFKIHDVLGKNIFSIYKLEDKKREIIEKIKNNEYWNGKLEFLKNDGKKVIEESVIFPIKNNDREIINICKIARDITKDIEMEEYVRHLQKMEAIGTLAAGIAHDFNNILTVINGYSEIVLNKLDKNTNLYKYVHSIYEAGLKGENLTKQLLAFSKKQLINPEIVDINEVIISLFGMLRRLISEDINIELRITENLPLIKADKTQLEQILVNLIINARDAIKEKEKLTKIFEKKIIISTGSTISDNILKSLSPNQKYIYLYVSDTGIGMNDEVKKRVFEPFFTTKPKNKGTGLGLSTVYGIVKQNNGFIFIDSIPEIGTTIKIYWPTVKDRFIESKDSEENNNLSGNARILIVEDDQNILNLLKEGLISYGYIVYTANDGEKALKIFNEKNLDLIIADVIMPRMSGKELYDTIKKIKPNMNFIFISGYPENELSDKEGFLIKDIEFIQKPFTLKELLIKIKNILKSRENINAKKT